MMAEMENVRTATELRPTPCVPTKTHRPFMVEDHRIIRMPDVCCRRTAACEQLASHSRQNCELGHAKLTNFRAFFRLGAKSEEQHPIH
jgi:hypothetical protein